MFLLVGHSGLLAAIGADSWVLHGEEEVAHVEHEALMGRLRWTWRWRLRRRMTVRRMTVRRRRV
jgi:hypothetical protein